MSKYLNLPSLLWPKCFTKTKLFYNPNLLSSMGQLDKIKPRTNSGGENVSERKIKRESENMENLCFHPRSQGPQGHLPFSVRRLKNKSLREELQDNLEFLQVLV